MGFCRSRHFMLVVCLLQFITVIQRQVFDYLGYLYIPILLNFFQIIFIIFGSFGAYQYRPKYIITYVLWNFVWLGWNVFLICLYLDMGVLNHKENMVLKLDKESGSWWVNGPGCKSTWDADKNDINVDGCLMDYEYIEVFQGALQTILAALAIICGLCLSKVFLDEDDSFNYMGHENELQHKSIKPMYVDINNCQSSISRFACITNNNVCLNHHGSLPIGTRFSDDSVTLGKVASSDGDGDVLLLGNKYLLYDNESGKNSNRHTVKATELKYYSLPQSYRSTDFYKQCQPKA